MVFEPGSENLLIIVGADFFLTVISNALAKKRRIQFQCHSHQRCLGGIESMYKRYGKFQMADYIFLWIAIVIFTGMGIVGLLVFPFNFYNLILISTPFLADIVIVCDICNPHRECFEIVDGTIVAQKGRKKTLKKIPEEVTLVIGYANNGRSFVPGKTNGKYALSIFRNMDMKKVLKRIDRLILVRRACPPYVMFSVTEVIEEYQFIYSFICEKTLLQETICKMKGNLLMPKSLADEISIKNQMITVYMDPRY